MVRELAEQPKDDTKSVTQPGDSIPVAKQSAMRQLTLRFLEDFRKSAATGRDCVGYGCASCRLGSSVKARLKSAVAASVSPWALKARARSK